MGDEEILVMTHDARVRIMLLAPGEGTVFHHHSRVTDHIFCLSGRIKVRLKDPRESRVLVPGGRIEVPPFRVHSVGNALAETVSQYLLVQGGGTYDFLAESLC